MSQTELGAAVARFLDAIPRRLLPPAETLDVIRRATEGDFSPQDSTVVSMLLGPAASWGSELVTEPRTLIWPADHGMHMDVANGWYFLVSNLEVVGEEGTRIAVVTIPMRTTSVPPAIREELGWKRLDAQVVDSNVKMTIVAPDGSIDVLREVNVQAGIDGGLELEYRPFRAMIDQDSLIGGEDDPFPLDEQMRAHYEGDAEGGSVTIDLSHERVEPYFLQGYDGYIPISDKAGYLYYSAAQLKTSGTITYAGREFEVSGVSWFDHQWGVGAPEPASEPKAQPLPALPPRVGSLVPASKDTGHGWVWFGFNFEGSTALTLAAPHGPPPVPEPCELPTWGKFVLPEKAETVDVEGKVILTEFMTNEETNTRWPCGWEFGLRKSGTSGPLDMTVKAAPWAEDQFGTFASLQQFWEGGADVVAWDLVGEPGVILNGVGFCESVGFEPAQSYLKRALEFLQREK